MAAEAVAEAIAEEVTGDSTGHEWLWLFFTGESGFEDEWLFLIGESGFEGDFLVIGDFFVVCNTDLGDLNAGGGVTTLSRLWIFLLLMCSILLKEFDSGILTGSLAE